MMRWAPIGVLCAVLAACSAGAHDGTAGGATEAFSQTTEALTPTISLPGPVLKNPRVVSVLWGSGVYASDIAPEFFTDLVTGPYLNLLNPYGVSTGSFAGQVTITPKNQAAWLSLPDLQKELATDIPLLPAWDANTVYVVLLPHGFGLQDTNSDGSVVQQCAYHNSFQFSDSSGTHDAAFAVVSSCAANSVCEGAGNYLSALPFHSQASDFYFAVSHEVIEAAVHPVASTNPEVGDPCDDGSTNGGVGWTTMPGTDHSWIVQRPWITSLGSCVSLPVPDPITPSAANSDAFAVARLPGNVDAFFVGSNGAINNDFFNANGWGVNATTNPKSAAQGAAVVATARTGNNLDIFWFGIDGALYTAYWPQGSPWAACRITAMESAPSGGQLAAVARTGTTLDVFWVGNDRNLHTADWDESRTNGNSPGNCGGTGWNLLTLTNTPVAAPGAPVAAVARTKHNLDVFWINTIGNSNTMQTAFSFDAGATWGTLTATMDGAAAAGSFIAATAQIWSRLDVFWLDQSGNVQQGTWTDNELFNPNWNNRPVPPASDYATTAHISAVTRQPGYLDLFLVGLDGAVYNPYFNQFDGWGQVRASSGNLAPSGTAIAGTTRTPINLDVIETGIFGIHFDTSWSGSNNTWGTSSIP